ncbi:SusC/RagA family TonB-linked outer membrane protein [Flavobacterium piscisymbiosum]|uniref:TonB-dependent receptor n=1 Tax=Flavobacterium piscisymbiosum TaxID=2893753 RepID=A0ABS8MH90_9FLAO|nr:TonB-dependent receptor [Flavobacterium sp. F-30]MCC9064847.1 TonB-dependent receptor [Flavobacterium sp. F-30]
MKLKNFILLSALMLTSFVFAQEKYTLTGTVIADFDKLSLPGANVTVLGSKTTIITDAEGKFSIPVNENSSIQVSFVGMKTRVVLVNGQRNITISLVEDSKNLDEVVVVGYGTQKKSSITGSVSKLENTNLDEIPVSRVDKALQGRIAGLQIQNTTSEVGEAPQIRIRGMGSISASSDPLVVVDGFPISNGLEFINPSTIESIEVLKDASSTAIYGSRGANGVILVTTKSGSETKTLYQFKSFFGVKSVYEKIDMYDTYEYTDMLRRERQLQENYTAGLSGAVPATIGYTSREKGMREVANHSGGGTDWQDEGIRNFATIKNYELNVSGGGKNATYYISGQYIEDEGLMKDNFLNRVNFQTRVKAKLSDKLTLDVNLRPSYSFKRRSTISYSDLTRSLSFMPSKHNEYTSALTGYPVGEYAHGRHFNNVNFNYTDENGVQQNFTTSLWGTNNNSPISRMENEERYIHDYRMLTNFVLEYKINKRLTFKTSGGVNLDYSNYERFRNSQADQTGQAIGEDDSNLKADLLTENTLNYKWKNKKHSIDALGGITYQKTNIKGTGIYGTQFPSDYIGTLNGANVIDANETFTRKEQIGLLSFLARVNYAYKDKYLLSIAARADGSSLFGPDNKYGIFPSASVGWNVSEENFWKQNIQWVNRFKLRTSFGITGNNDITNYSFTNLLYSSNYSLGQGAGSVTSGLGETGDVLGNPEIGWEQTLEYDSGADLSFFGNKLNATFDYYYSITDKLLLQQNVSYITGHNQFFNNIGKIQNKGFEVEISGNVRAKNFTWKPAFNISFNQNKLISLGGEAQFISQGERNEEYIAKVGEEAVQFYGYKMIGVWQTADELANNPHSADDAVGGIRVADINGDGVINASDRTTLGSPFPDFTWGFYNAITFNRFDMNFLIQGSVGGEVFFGDGYYNEMRYLYKDFAQDRWFSEGVPASKPRENNGRAWQNTSYLVQDATYMSLRNVTLGFSAPEVFTSKLGITKARFYLSGENLLFVKSSGFFGLNPEGITNSGVYSSPLISGYQRGAFPVQRTISFGIDINF